MFIAILYHKIKKNEIQKVIYLLKVFIHSLRASSYIKNCAARVGSESSVGEMNLPFICQPWGLSTIIFFSELQPTKVSSQINLTEEGIEMLSSEEQHLKACRPIDESPFGIEASVSLSQEKKARPPITSRLCGKFKLEIAEHS